jgi:hypothetical protein
MVCHYNSELVLQWTMGVGLNPDEGRTIQKNIN